MLMRKVNEKDRNLNEDVIAAPKALTWRVYLAFLFAAFIIQPAFIYYSLITNLSLPLATWIPILVWSELANIVRAKLYKQELLLLVAFQPISLSYSLFALNLIKNTYYSYSEGVAFFGITEYIPSWFVPRGKDLVEVINSPFFFFHRAWLVPIGLQLAVLMLGLVTELVIGYLSYQVFVINEKLEFPAARAQVATIETLAERDPGLIRPLFLSALAGAIVHIIGKFIPFVIGPFLAGGLTIYIYAMPYFDVTPYLDYLLKGSAFIIPLDPVFYIPGFLLPIRTALIQFIGAFSLYFIGGHIVTRFNLWPPESVWTTGWGYWTLQYRSLLYFFVSFIIGLSLAAMIVPLALNPKPLIRGIQALRRSMKSGRGFISPKILLLTYIGTSMGLVLIAWWLTNFEFPIWVLLLFIVGGTFFANYIATASAGVTFLGVNVPYLRELAIYYSGYPKKDIWFVPLPLSISGSIGYIGPASSVASVPIGGSTFAQGLFQADLLNVKHSEYIKAFIILLLISLAGSFFYTSLFWYVARIPSSAYPATIISWPVDAINWARMQVWVWSGYLFNSTWILFGLSLGSAMAAITNFLRVPYFLPIMITGALWGIPFTFAQLVASIISEKIIGPQIGRQNWMRYRPLIVMGYTIGDGLMETLRAIMILTSKSSWILPF